jgi:hypothetical protein
MAKGFKTKQTAQLPYGIPIDSIIGPVNEMDSKHEKLKVMRVLEFL